MDLQTTEIQGQHFQCDPFDFDEGFDILVEMAQALSNGLKGEATSIAELVSSLDLGDLVARLPAALRNAGGSKFVARLVRRCVWVEGEKHRVKLDDTGNRARCFGTDYALAVKVCLFALETNYAESFRGLVQSSPKP
jgi:hypothetical protein